jgi:hypothetical protein
MNPLIIPALKHFMDENLLDFLSGQAIIAAIRSRNSQGGKL